MKSAIIPRTLEELKIDLCTQGVKYDTLVAYGVTVSVYATFHPAGGKYEEAAVKVEKIQTAGITFLFGEGCCLELQVQSDVMHLMPKGDVEAIEEGLLVQMGGAA